MLLIIAGLWVGVFVPSWFRRSHIRQVERRSANSVREEITRASITPGISLAKQNFRLRLTQTIFSLVAGFSFFGLILTIFAAVSQTFFIYFSGVFLAVFIASVAVLRAAKRKSRGLLTRASRDRAAKFSTYSSTAIAAENSGISAENPVNKRDWAPNALPAPRQRVGELSKQTLAEVVEIEDHIAKNATVELNSTVLDEILRRRRANG